MKIHHLAILFLLALMVFAVAAPVSAAPDPAQAEEISGDEADSYLDRMNHAQRAKAENIAAAVMDPENYDFLVQALETVELAQLAYDEAVLTGDPTAIDQAEQDLLEAQRLADESWSEALGMEAEEIAAMREDGMGWGVICHELGVHPSILGLGHFKNKHEYTYTVEEQTEEQTKAKFTKTKEVASTTRSVTGGVANGHGLKSDGTSQSNNGLGQEKSKANKGGPGKSTSASSSKGGDSKSSKSKSSANSNKDKSKSNNGKSKSKK